MIRQIESKSKNIVKISPRMEQNLMLVICLSMTK
nr:MAG TPA: hypothetical protein [Caudoviricetes sp.]